MSDKWITLATFSTPIEASIVRNRLEADGIRAFLADEATVGMAWYLGNAVGGVKLQVAEDDVARAHAILEASDAVLVTADDWQSDQIEEASGAEADGQEEDQPDSPADEIVARAFRAAVLGLILIPLQLYSLWLLARVVSGSTPMSAANRRRALAAVILDLQIFIIAAILLWDLFSEWNK